MHNQNTIVKLFVRDQFDQMRKDEFQCEIDVDRLYNFYDN